MAQPRQANNPPVTIAFNDSRKATLSIRFVNLMAQRPFRESGRAGQVVITLHRHPEHHDKNRSKPAYQDKWTSAILPGKRYNVPLKLEQGRQYTVTVEASVESPTGRISLPPYVTNFRSTYTPEELGRLLHKAKEYLTIKDLPGSFYPLYYFFRDKHDGYFADIFHHRRGVMEAYTKDRNGDPASPINETLKGLFFGVNVSGPEGHPRKPSHFGPRRLLIPAQVMFGIMPNLYFTDFYCLKKAHYVTLVMTKSGSIADNFCQKRLIKLNIANNPFVRYKDGVAAVTTHVVVEIFCTENINLAFLVGYARIVDVPCVGHSWKHGIPKNPNCEKCNLAE